MQPPEQSRRDSENDIQISSSSHHMYEATPLPQLLNRRRFRHSPVSVLASPPPRARLSGCRACADNSLRTAATGRLQHWISASCVKVTRKFNPVEANNACGQSCLTSSQYLHHLCSDPSEQTVTKCSCLSRELFKTPCLCDGESLCCLQTILTRYAQLRINKHCLHPSHPSAEASHCL